MLVHKATTHFWKYFDALPKEVQQKAREQFELLKSNPYHPSLHLRRLENFGRLELAIFTET